MSYTKRYLEDVVDELAKELDEDWCHVNDVFMDLVSDGLPVERAKVYTKEHFETLLRLRTYGMQTRCANERV